MPNYNPNVLKQFSHSNKVTFKLFLISTAPTYTQYQNAIQNDTAPVLLDRHKTTRIQQSKG